MSALPSWNRYPCRFTIVFGAVALLLFVLEHINGRFWLNDFRVYYGAGEALLQGEPIYGVARGLDTGVFKYAPMLALVHALFALLPYGLAASIQYLLITLAFLDGLRRVDRLVRDRLLGGRVASYLPLFLTAFVCVVHLHRELHLGNINMMLLWLLVVALEALLAGKPLRGGILLGAAMLAKPHFVVLLPLLVLRRKWNTVGMAVVTIGVGLLLPAVFLGWSGNMEVHTAWLGAMAEHNAALIYTGGDDYRAVNTVYSFLHRAVLKHVLGTPSNLEAYALLACIAGLFGVFVLNNLRKDQGDRSFPFEYLLLVALVPSITLTDTEHFLLALPLVVYLIHHLLPHTTSRSLPWIAALILFAYGGNWEDAMGPLSDGMIHYGVLGIGNMALLVSCTLLFLRSNLSPDKLS